MGEKGQKADEEDYATQVSPLRQGAELVSDSSNVVRSQQEMAINAGPNHFHLVPNQEIKMTYAEPSNSWVYHDVIVEIVPVSSNRLLIFCHPRERISLIMTASQSVKEVCVSVFCEEEWYHELVVDSADQLYVAAMPGHEYIIRSGYDWQNSSYNFELHAGRLIELDIDDNHVSHVSVPPIQRQFVAKSGLIFINRSEANVETKLESLAVPLTSLLVKPGA